MPTRTSARGLPSECPQPSSGRCAAAWASCSSFARRSFSCSAACASFWTMPTSQPLRLRIWGCCQVSRNLSTARCLTSPGCCASRRRPLAARPPSPKGTLRSLLAVSGSKPASSATSSRTRSWILPCNHSRRRARAASSASAPSAPAAASRAQAASGTASTLWPAALQTRCRSASSPRGRPEVGCRGARASRSTTTPRPGRKKGMA
mmetsp:Transcript_86879/g.281332  ORF Transcript_86879/g.281332 Transcript_86879/m.281332 type:complete len:206 (-) Transcript_86879:504-1121(-)